MPSKINPVAHYLFALAFTICAYTLYAKFAVPVIEGPPVSLRRQQPAQIPINPRTEGDKSYLAALVPEHAWELESCKMLLTPQGTIFFKEWTRVDDEGTYDLFPFTLVMNDPGLAAREGEEESKSGKKKSPTILRSIAGATLKFTKPLILGSDQEKAEMQSARLQGNVTIFQPAADPAKDQDLRVLTRNVQIDRHRIFTLDDVDFEYGEHRGSGRNLSIELAHDQTNYASRTFSTISGVNQLELASVSRLVLQPEDKRGMGQSGNKTGTKTAAFSNVISPLELSCDGPFLFQFEKRTAEFQQNVVVRQLDEFGDNIHCSQLKVVFADSDADKTQSTNAIKTQIGPANQAGMRVESFLALGSDALGLGTDQPAVITSHSRQARIVGHRIEFDVKTGIVHAGGSQQVSVSSPQLSFFAKELEYGLVDNGSMGPLTATGPGELVRNSDDPTRGFSARWTERLTIRPYVDAADPNNSRNERRLIVLQGDALVKMGTENSIASDKLDLVVWQLPAPEVLAQIDPTQPDSKQQKWQYLPSWLATRGQVRILTPQLEGTAREFIAKWPQPI